MFKWILILTLGFALWMVYGWFTGKGKPWETKRPPPAASVPKAPSSVVAKVEKLVESGPPSELLIGGWYSIPGEAVKVKFPDEYGFLKEGDFYKEWRIKKLMGQGCILISATGHEYLVRLRISVPDFQKEVIPPPSQIAVGDMFK